VCALVEVEDQRIFGSEGERGFAYAGLGIDTDVDTFDVNRFRGFDNAKCHDRLRFWRRNAGENFVELQPN
jgi:hypothetical protein